MDESFKARAKRETRTRPVTPVIADPNLASCAFCVCATMIIYKCRFTNDEMLSDAFKPTPVKDDEGNEVPGLIKIQSQKVNKVRTYLLIEDRHL